MINIFAALVLAGLIASDSQPSSLPSAHEKPSIRYSDCRCPAEIDSAVIILEGLVIDAEMTLKENGLSPADRQATIFNITLSDTDIKGRTRIWHSTKRNQCGVNFNYGRKYKVAVRKTEEGFETDACLMRRVRPAE